MSNKQSVPFIHLSQKGIAKYLEYKVNLPTGTILTLVDIPPQNNAALRVINLTIDQKTSKRAKSDPAHAILKILPKLGETEVRVNVYDDRESDLDKKWKGTSRMKYHLLKGNQECRSNPCLPLVYFEPAYDLNQNPFSLTPQQSGSESKFYFESRKPDTKYGNYQVTPPAGNPPHKFVFKKQATPGNLKDEFKFRPGFLPGLIAFEIESKSMSLEAQVAGRGKTEHDLADDKPF